MASPMTSLTSRTVNLSQQLQLQKLVFFVFLVSVAEPKPSVLERLWSLFFYLVGAEASPGLRLKMWWLRKTGSCLGLDPFGGTKFLMRPTPPELRIRIRIQELSGFEYGSVFPIPPDTGALPDVAVLYTGALPDTAVLDTEALPDIAVLDTGAKPDVAVLDTGVQPDIAVLDTGAPPDVAVLDRGAQPDIAVLDTVAIHIAVLDRVLYWIQVPYLILPYWRQVPYLVLLYWIHLLYILLYWIVSSGYRSPT